MFLALLAIWTNKRRSQLAKNTGVVQAAGDGVVQAAHRRSWCFCVWRSWCFCVCGCVAGIGARAHQVSDEERYSIFILRPPKLVRMRVRVRIRVHVTGGVLARSLTYVGRLSNSLTGGGQTKVQRWPNKVDLRAEWPLQGIQSEKVASGRCSPFDQSCGSIRPQLYSYGTCFYPSPCFGHIPARCTYFWPLPNNKLLAPKKMK